jgi:hypothetical protein
MPRMDSARRSPDVGSLQASAAKRTVLLKKLALPALVVASVFVSLGMLEVVFRITEFPFRPRGESVWGPIAQFDPELGWSYLPNRTIVENLGTPPRSIELHTNDIGARVGTAGQSVRRGVPTLLFVGDSFTRGKGVAFEDSFPGILDADPELSLQVVNLGVDAYGTDQSYLMLKRYFDEFDVRAVVHAFIGDHMARNAIEDWRLINPECRFPGTKPRFALGAEGDLRLIDTPRRYETFDSSYVYALLRMLWLQRGPEPTPELSIALVKEMQAFSEERGARFVLIHWDQWDENWQRWRAGDSPFRSHVHSLVETSRDAPADWDTWVVPGDNHPDERAHRRVAALLEEQLERLGVMETSPD